jgi:protein TonB
MRASLIPLLCLLPVVASAGQPYQPRFVRNETPAMPLDLSLCPRPEYPRSSVRNEETGVVTLRFIIAPNGRVVSSAVARSSGFRDLDNAAFAAIKQCRFRPASIDNVPVQSPAYVQYVWTLD